MGAEQLVSPPQCAHRLNFSAGFLSSPRPAHQCRPGGHASAQEPEATSIPPLRLLPPLRPTCDRMYRRGSPLGGHPLCAWRLLVGTTGIQGRGQLAYDTEHRGNTSLCMRRHAVVKRVYIFRLHPFLHINNLVRIAILAFSVLTPPGPTPA